MVVMGEYADMEIEREQRETGARLHREHMRELAAQTPEQRRAAGQAEQARNMAVHEAREQALAAAVAHAATKTAALASANLTIHREGRCIEARRGRSVLGRWWPGKRSQLGARTIAASTFAAWLTTVVKAWRTPSRPR